MIWFLGGGAGAPIVNCPEVGLSFGSIGHVLGRSRHDFFHDTTSPHLARQVLLLFVAAGSKYFCASLLLCNDSSSTRLGLNEIDFCTAFVQAREEHGQQEAGADAFIHSQVIYRFSLRDAAFHAIDTSIPEGIFSKSDPERDAKSHSLNEYFEQNREIRERTFEIILDIVKAQIVAG